MDMNVLIDYCKKNSDSQCNYWNALYAMLDSEALSYDELVELYILAGMDNDAAEFLAEYYPECAYAAIANLRYTYGFDHELRQMTEDELSEHLDFLEVSEEDYQENCGTIIRDAAFDGVIVIGE